MTKLKDQAELAKCAGKTELAEKTESARSADKSEFTKCADKTELSESADKAGLVSSAAKTGSAEAAGKAESADKTEHTEFAAADRISSYADRTISYYDANAADFVNTTQTVDFHETQEIFLSYLQPHGELRILDFGCGSGRDAKYFINQGYRVTAADGSAEICKAASEYLGQPVRHMLFHELNDRDIYDGIWACASILHLTKKELPGVLCRMSTALRENGVIYTSFKYGTFEGERNGRYFTYFTEESFGELLAQIPGLQIEKMWTTGDVREGRGDERWLNVILRRIYCL